MKEIVNVRRLRILENGEESKLWDGVRLCVEEAVQLKEVTRFLMECTIDNEPR